MKELKRFFLRRTVDFFLAVSMVLGASGLINNPGFWLLRETMGNKRGALVDGKPKDEDLDQILGASGDSYIDPITRAVLTIGEGDGRLSKGNKTQGYKIVKEGDSRCLADQEVKEMMGPWERNFPTVKEARTSNATYCLLLERDGTGYLLVNGKEGTRVDLHAWAERLALMARAPESASFELDEININLLALDLAKRGENNQRAGNGSWLTKNPFRAIFDVRTDSKRGLQVVWGRQKGGGSRLVGVPDYGGDDPWLRTGAIGLELGVGGFIRELEGNFSDVQGEALPAGRALFRPAKTVARLWVEALYSLPKADREIPIGYPILGVLALLGAFRAFIRRKS